MCTDDGGCSVSRTGNYNNNVTVMVQMMVIRVKSDENELETDMGLDI